MTDIIQGSPEWFALRLGKVTASRVADVVAKTKTGWGASRANYMAELIAERLTGTTAVSYTNAAMQWGTEKEPEGRAAYTFYTDQIVELVGFVEHPTIRMSGASPDGHVGVDGSIEVKAPNTATHIDTLLSGTVPPKYRDYQIQWQLACSGRKWCDFVSFDPRMPEAMRMFTRRVNRDDTLIKQLEKDVVDFLAELDAKVVSLKKLYDRAQAA